MKRVMVRGQRRAATLDHFLVPAAGVRSHGVAAGLAIADKQHRLRAPFDPMRLALGRFPEWCVLNVSTYHRAAREDSAMLMWCSLVVATASVPCCVPLISTWCLFLIPLSFKDIYLYVNLSVVFIFQGF